MAENVILHVWPGEWELPSLDPECLTVMCYLKYSQIEHTVQVVDKNWDLFKNPLPRLTFKNEVFIGIDEIIDFVKQKKNVDLFLSDKSYPDMVAILCLFKQKFIPAFNSLCWLDNENTFNVIRRAYGKYLWFPFSLIKLRAMADNVKTAIMSNYRSTHVQFESINQHIIYESKECLNIISAKLGQNLFMFENKPSLLDAYLFGYLSILNKAPFANSILKSHLSASSNMCSLIARIQIENFPINKKEIEGRKAQELAKRMKFLSWLNFFSLKSWSRQSPSSPTSKLTELEEWEKRKQQLAAFSIALSAMLIYAFAIGFIRIDIMKTDVEYVEKN
ncbi:metaxin-3 isoform X1 [Brachionus plicatilis]|uniref:Metaxin-3 isoform X1 n=1 Tax=Brachionus plicatilis TaxID=10195 RepID=A0A3M7QL59_BRAPC|nr:metaxin-3 isoform X1 [Brachionus plicatilis]